ncbi:MAG: hypothetical protein QFF03_08790 [Pseudomonadota bacterium]|nr:hypothetical protein [Pseudomonadota bacterium]
MKFAASIGAAACLLIATATATATATVTAAGAADPHEQFMATLRGLCGQHFEGALAYAIDPKNDFVGKKMSADVVCSASDVRFPLQVGEDRSRTWIFSRGAAGLELRHDHRHPDGTPDAVTMYGGMANDSGSALSQSFLADQHTFAVFPGSETNIWTISLSADASTLTYHLERHAKPRITFILKRVAH